MSLFADAGRPRWSNVRYDSASNDYEDCSIDESLLEELEIERDTVMELVDNAEEEQFTNVGINKWLVDVKHIIYDADTLLDEINTEAQFKELYEADGSYSSDTLTEFERVATGKIKQITKKLVNFAEVGKRRGLKPSVERRAAAAAQQIQVPNARLTSSVLAESVSVHCRKKEKEEIVKWVCSSPDPAAGGNVKVDVMAIIGMGGLGKTTLARFVYNHPCVGHFRRSWACVSDKLDLVRVTKDILESLTEHPVGFCSLNTLQQELKKELEGKKFLIVLDDVWESSKEILENLMAPFSSGAKGSKIIITTRDQDVASIVSAVYDRLALKPMSEEEGWSLFSNDVFRDDDISQHSKLEAIGKKIVMKCGGLPLAIKTLSGVLCSERDEIKWKGILESSFWKLRGGRNDIVPALALSYSYLPSHLKTCFAYCSLFPKDHKFLEEELVYLWIDEGFVKQSKDNTSVEDASKAYFKELLSRSFFTKQDPCYVMHDLIHDLALMVYAWSLHGKMDSLPSV